ncbi:MAG: PAS domain-containing sensor histidine kinase [Tateyamaria sp.]|nr:PAS domain-containing sensor histidine kinase [Tateyamaria sp.]MBT5300730.1 PAS domain-containing sensor histidine kinase [Tateyamaria sp.]MBT6266749.1 PAS domain-containing sensor histidine kinase [Tateyamaria sp.]MBT6342587.1 PAS domain-containing sensor histidine kinase [Tateyamaria sp.]MBT7800142.1 PAS domain-containing sensor histidine kinase [Tateyamaria sp.]
MALKTRTTWSKKLDRLRRTKRVRTGLAFSLVLLGPILALTTFLVLGPLDQGASAPALRLILLADFVYVLIVAALVLSQIGRLVAARRAKSAGSQLHLRLTGAFALLALIPTVTVAIFAGLTLNIGLEGWFSERVSSVVGSSLAAAEAYETEQRGDLATDGLALARYIDTVRNAQPVGDREVLTDGQLQVQRGLREAYLVDGTGELRARGDRSYLFDFEQPSPKEILDAKAEGFLIIEDWANNEFRALVPLSSFVDRYLYISRDVDGEILSLLDETQETVRLYQQLESERGRVVFEFGLIYLGFALILILAAIWMGFWFAERLSGPIGRLTGAAQRVGTGDLDVQVLEEDGDDEIAMLGRYFNQMIKQLKRQRKSLVDNNNQIERRRRLFDSVLGSVTSGVVGLDASGIITFVNRSGVRLLDWDEGKDAVPMAVAVPEFEELFLMLKASRMEVVQDEVKVIRNGSLENLLVRMSTRRGEDETLEGYVIAFDDVTDLVSAQRMAAWGDVARRIAHEIKNPLTPIQLSAERIKRKFGPRLGENSESLEQMTDVIIRQTGDLRRIVDEFSKFARMPEPECKTHDLAALVRDSVLLQRLGQPTIKILDDLPVEPVLTEIDATMISQALTNLMKNAGEAVETLRNDNIPPNHVALITVKMQTSPVDIVITISDSGIGLPEDRTRLFEPYVTTRNEGTGLGLPIVKKIIEEHGGTLSLDDAAPFEGCTHFGAKAVITLPIAHSLIEQE